MKNNSIIFGVCLLLWGIAGCYDYPQKDIKYEATPNVQSLSLFVGENFQLRANPTELNFSWTSDDPEIATVNSSGMVTAVGRGMTIINARAGDVSCKIPLSSIVRIPLVNYILGVTSIEMIIGGSQEIKIVPEPTDANDMGTIGWSSNNPSIATVNYAGIVKCVGIGTTIVECNINDIVKTINVMVARTLPFNWPRYLTLTQPLVIKAVDFDLGGNGVAYYETNTGHNGNLGGNEGKYRAAGGDPDCFVGMETGSSMYGSNIGWNGGGKWQMFTFEVQEEGDYSFDVYISVNDGSAGYGIEVDGELIKDVNMTGGNGWQNYRWYHEFNPTLVPAPEMHLTVGRHSLKFKHNTGGFNYSAIRLKAIE